MVEALYEQLKKNLMKDLEMDKGFWLQCNEPLRITWNLDKIIDFVS